MTGGDTILYPGFAESAEAVILADKVRWERYMPEGMDPQDWVTILGPDASNRDHNCTQFGIAEFVIAQAEDRGVPLDERAKQTLLDTNHHHDLPEAYKGDITFVFKTDETDAEEEGIMPAILSSGDYDYLSSARQAAVVDTMQGSRQPAPSQVAELFAFTESLGYTNTMLRAGRLLRITAQTGELGPIPATDEAEALQVMRDFPDQRALKNGLSNLVLNVFSNNTARLNAFRNPHNLELQPVTMGIFNTFYRGALIEARGAHTDMPEFMEWLDFEYLDALALGKTEDEAVNHYTTMFARFGTTQNLINDLVEETAA